MHPSRPWSYAMNFRKIIRDHGPYDVVHSHVHHFSGLVLLFSQNTGIPKLIAHSHSDTTYIESSIGLFRTAYLRVMELLIRRCATSGLAASEKAASSLFGDDWKKDERLKILHCGVDLDPFSRTVNKAEIRAQLGLPQDEFVIGHVGRFIQAKNHKLLLKIFTELIKDEPNTRLLLIGDGPLRQKIEKQVDMLGLNQKIVFAGVRSDVPRLMIGAMDVLVMPSLYEGLPLVLMEAQAAGLPCFISDLITQEADVVPSLCYRISLTTPVCEWANIILRHGKINPTSKSQAIDIVSHSSFNIKMSVEKLKEIYLV
jgi:glycosyltransferase involved in cell wall biosynthesis